jgi:hypothetical protein
MPEQHMDGALTAVHKSSIHKDGCGWHAELEICVYTQTAQCVFHRTIAHHYNIMFMSMPILCVVPCSLISHLFLNRLDSVGILEQLRKLALLALQLRVTTDVLLADEDVGDGALVGHLLESVLDGGAIVCAQLLDTDTQLNVNAC